MEFEINFLPQNKIRWLGYLQGKGRLIFFVLLGVIVMVSLISLYGKVITKRQQKLVAVGQDFLKVTQEKKKVSELAALLSTLKKERLTWTEKMIALGDVTPDQVFLTSLEYRNVKTGTRGSKNLKDREKLVVKGVVIPSGEESPSSSIQNFMKNLKDDSSFMAGFEAPILISVNNLQKEGGVQGLEFEFQLLRKQNG